MKNFVMNIQLSFIQLKSTCRHVVFVLSCSVDFVKLFLSIIQALQYGPLCPFLCVSQKKK